MGVQRGMDRRRDWLWRPLKCGAGRGVGGVSAGRGGGVEVGGSGAMTRELWWGGKEGMKEGTKEKGLRNVVGWGGGGLFWDPGVRWWGRGQVMIRRRAGTRLAGSGRAGLRGGAL